MFVVEKERKRQGNEIGSQWNVVAAAAVLSLHQVRMNLMKRELKQKQKQRQQQQSHVQYKQCLPGSNGFREITLHERTNEMNILHHWQAT